MPPPVRAPRTSGFRNPLKLAPVRSAGSTALDIGVSKNGQKYPPFVRFDHFQQWWRERDRHNQPVNFKQGQHCTIVGPTGSGKTVLARSLILPEREYVVVLGTKNKDPELYEPLADAGYVVEAHFDPEPEEGDTKVIFRPKLTSVDDSARLAQREAFRGMLTEVFLAGGWCVYADEVRYLTDNLSLKTQFETLWLQGRSLDITLVVATQNPVSIPLLAFDMATHLFLFRNSYRDRADRMAEYTGENYQLAREVILQLPHHEFLYANTVTGQMFRSKVIRSGS